MNPPEFPELSAPQALAATIDALRSPPFCTHLTAWLQAVVPYSFTVIFAYHKETKPLDIYDDFPTLRRKVFVTDYLEGPYLLDPFCQAAILPVTEGLYRLRDVAPDRFYQGEYFHTYYKRTEIAEELGFFAQMPGDCQVVLSLMRQEKVFSPAAFRRLQAVSPVVCALMRQHWGDIAKTFSARATPRPALQGLERLTPRERDIVAYILKGHSAEATGEALSIATGTVRIHRRNIYAKLGISSQRELFAHFFAGARG